MNRTLEPAFQSMQMLGRARWTGYGGWKSIKLEQKGWGTVDEILQHQKDGWNSLNNGMFTIYQLVIQNSQPSTVSHESNDDPTAGTIKIPSVDGCHSPC